MNILEAVTVDLPKDLINAVLSCWEVLICGSQRSENGFTLVISGEEDQIVNCIFDLVETELNYIF